MLTGVSRPPKLTNLEFYTENREHALDIRLFQSRHRDILPDKGSPR